MLQRAVIAMRRVKSHRRGGVFTSVARPRTSRSSDEDNILTGL